MQTWFSRQWTRWSPSRRPPPTTIPCPSERNPSALPAGNFLHLLVAHVVQVVYIFSSSKNGWYIRQPVEYNVGRRPPVLRDGGLPRAGWLGERCSRQCNSDGVDTTVTCPTWNTEEDTKMHLSFTSDSPASMRTKKVYLSFISDPPAPKGAHRQRDLP